MVHFCHYQSTAPGRGGDFGMVGKGRIGRSSGVADPMATVLGVEKGETIEARGGGYKWEV
jgi:hypothetical protein